MGYTKFLTKSPDPAVDENKANGAGACVKDARRLTWVSLQGVVLHWTLVESPHAQHLQPKGLCRVQDL